MSVEHEPVAHSAEEAAKLEQPSVESLQSALRAADEYAGQLTAALERAERERDTAMEAMREWNSKWKYASEHANAAEARAQKAEAVVEAARADLDHMTREIAGTSFVIAPTTQALIDALSAYDEPPPEEVKA